MLSLVLKDFIFLKLTKMLCSRQANPEVHIKQMQCINIHDTTI